MHIPLEQALYHRADAGSPALITRSPGFLDDWLEEAERLIVGFGERVDNRRCPLAVFALPLVTGQITLARVMDDESGAGLRFHFFVVSQVHYEGYIRDPFMLAEKFAPTWNAEATLPTLMMPPDTFAPRTVAQVQEVLKRVKATALTEGEDPASADFSRTIDNSESPALLGGAQVLVDGGRLVFHRTSGDLRMVSGLWMLLPEMTRCRLWPTSFAYCADLEFDVVVLPRVDEELLEDYTTEEQAADYPEGAYELALQRAAEHADQADLDAVFSRRDGKQTIRLAIIILILLSILVLIARWMSAG